ncbi:MAG: hypothetical protein SVK08_02195 [Halobacteriota archaeon]|nr:hypothetical protein [Halobacteriota archaeon]
MKDQRRPFQDETLFGPCMRHFYSRTTLGRPGDTREEPIKYTQTLNDVFHFDIMTEWHARVPAYGHLSKALTNHELESEIEALKKIDSFMEATGVSEDFIKWTIDAGVDSAMVTAEEMIAKADQMTTLEAIDDILTEEMEVEYGIFPPVIPVPQRVTPPVMSIIYGPSADCVYYHIDQFTNEYLWSWFNHIEDGIMTTGHGDLAHYDFFRSFSEKRHLITGEKIKNITVQRPTLEGLGLVSDILKDQRNETSPEYSKDPIYVESVTSAPATGQAQYTSRAFMEILGFLYFWSGGSILRGFPFPSYTTLYPVPGAFDLLLELPLDILGPRFVALLAGANLWLPMHSMTPLEVRFEVFGDMAIPPTYNESIAAYFTYGMDAPKYPPSYLQSKYLYGQDAQVREPTEYPVPERKIMDIGGAEEDINHARSDHEEWLISICQKI